jgi:hypothetical protein
MTGVLPFYSQKILKLFDMKRSTKPLRFVPHHMIMKTILTKRILSLLMALLFALGTLSCGPADQQSSPEVLADQDLTIVQTSVVYKRSEAIYLANQMEGIYTRAYKLINRQPLDPALQEEVNKYYD